MNNKIVPILILVLVTLLGSYFAKDYLINKVADKVVQKLQKNYCPSPYGPGLDPDKIDKKDDWN